MMLILAGFLVIIAVSGLWMISRHNKNAQATTKRRKKTRKSPILDYFLGKKASNRRKTTEKSSILDSFFGKESLIRRKITRKSSISDYFFGKKSSEGSETLLENSKTQEDNASLDHDPESSLAESVVEREEFSEPANKLKQIVMHVMAPKNCPYRGYELLQALLANGLRYGKMNIFHRHENKSSQGAVLFSLASVNQPGTFELPKMGSFSCPGLTLFLLVETLRDPVQAFDIMLETANQLKEDLGGVLWNADRENMSDAQIFVFRETLKAQTKPQKVLEPAPE